jgi:pimeloyl-ACP methyl ester carboxylesterase
VPLEVLHAQAAAANKRLVLCGHSLGGAVALLCTVKLLRAWAAARLGGGYAEAAAGAGGGRPLSGRQLAAAAAAAAAAPFADPRVRCITFAAPAVANEALAAEVVASGWDRYISNFVQPGEWWGGGVRVGWAGKGGRPAPAEAATGAGPGRVVAVC